MKIFEAKKPRTCSVCGEIIRKGSKKVVLTISNALDFFGLNDLKDYPAQMHYECFLALLVIKFPELKERKYRKIIEEKIKKITIMKLSEWERWANDSRKSRSKV